MHEFCNVSHCPECDEEFFFDASEVVQLPDLLDTDPRCCVHPQLSWNGTLNDAVIRCTSCGFVLADDGQLVDWHNPMQILSEREMQDSDDASEW